MVRFVCFYLRVLGDEEQRIIRATQQQVDSDSSSDSEEDSSDGENSKGGSEALQPRRTTRRQGPADRMKDARELFTFTTEQRRCAIRLWVALDGDDRGAQMEALLASISSFIFVTYHPVPLCTGLVQFLAVLGIDPEMARLRTAKNYSYMLAGMVYCTRVIATSHLLPNSQHDTEKEQDRVRL